MREIKFKSVRLGDEKYIVANPFNLYEYVQGNKEEVSLDAFLFPEGSLFLQFTGFKDKNGKEIYEGDILSCEDEDCEVKERSLIVFENGCFYDKAVSKEAPSIQPLFDLDMQETEVIGNIYENPELLEEGN